MAHPKIAGAGAGVGSSRNAMAWRGLYLTLDIGRRGAVLDTIMDFRVS
jgi:hypothetical protein